MNAVGIEMKREVINRFAQGDYAVKLYLNDEEKITLPFRVE